MIVSLDNSKKETTGFLVMPNRAMPWRQQLVLFSIIAAFSLGIAVGFFMQGLTLILPFAGLELLALGAALYISAWRGGRREVINIDNEKVTVEIGRDEPEQRFEFDRIWLKVVLQKSWSSWYPSRLLLRSHGRQIEIGSFLNEQERQALASTLRKALGS